MTEELALWFLGALWVVAAGLAGLVWRFLMARIMRLEEEVKETNKELSVTKSNYNAKFAATNVNIANVERNLTQSISELKDAIIGEIHGMQVHCASVHALISQPNKGVTP